jgi:hypothetical protein
MRNLKPARELDEVPVTKGCVIFAYDGAYPYIRIATRAAELVKQHLRLPVTLITDRAYINPAFDQVIVQPRTDPEQLREFEGELRPWHNQTRSTAYTLTPYDQTLLIDADYFVFSDKLRAMFDTEVDFACYGQAQELTSHTATLETHIGATSIPMQWATVLYFTKSELAEAVFDFMAYIKQHYEFYSLLYGFRNHVFRNDYALSIALQTLTGYNTGNYAQLPGVLLTATDRVKLRGIVGNSALRFSYNAGPRALVTSKVDDYDIHFLDKDQLIQFMDKWEYAKP